MQQANWNSRTIFIENNLYVMRGMNSKSVDLIYLDPPFNSNQDYAAPIGSAAAGAAFKDAWTLSDVDLVEHNRLKDESKALFASIEAARHAHSKSMFSYLIMMTIRLLEMKRLLRDTGNIFLHCDWNASHYLRSIMDGIFGYQNLRNEIVWRRASGRAKGSQYASKTAGVDTDSILHYSASKDSTYHGIYLEMTSEELKEKFPYSDQRGRYNTIVPLFRQPSMGARPNLCYEYKGVRNPHPSGWRVSKDKLSQLDAENRIIWREGQRPLRKSYADDYQGKPVGNLWLDISIASGKERIGYPTQKPLKLLDRIIKMSSNENDTVLDPFCGCATTCVAAELLGRNWVGIDVSAKAGELLRERIENVQGLWRNIKVLDSVPRRTDLGDELTPSQKKEHKHTLFRLQNYLCNGCNWEFNIKNLQMDHIVPKAKGGTDHKDNFQLLCSACNSKKGTKSQEVFLSELTKARNKNLAWLNN